MSLTYGKMVFNGPGSEIKLKLNTNSENLRSQPVQVFQVQGATVERSCSLSGPGIYPWPPTVLSITRSYGGG